MPSRTWITLCLAPRMSGLGDTLKDQNAFRGACDDLMRAMRVGPEELGSLTLAMMGQDPHRRLGMGDNLDLPERVCARTPMQWSTEPHAGFTKSDSPVVPVIDHGPYGYEHVNDAEQRRDPSH